MTPPRRAIHYLASPYTHADPRVMRERYEHVCQAAALLHRRGMLVYSPIAHSVAVNEYIGSDGAFAAWRDYDLGMIDRLDGVLVLMLPGWEDSYGVAQELLHTRERAVPVQWVIPELRDGRVAELRLRQEYAEAATA